MVRTILAIATAGLAAALFGSAAQACISCEYTPEVVKGSQTSSEPKSESRAPSRERAYAPERQEREPVRAAKRRPEPAEEKVDTAARTPAAKETTKDADSENSSIAAISKAFDAPAATATADAKPSDSEHSSIAVVSELAPTAIGQADAKKADSENSSIAGVVVERKIERAENSSISVASIAAPVAEAATPVAKATDCKKFVSSVGMIVSVSCD